MDRLQELKEKMREGFIVTQEVIFKSRCAWFGSVLCSEATLQRAGDGLAGTEQGR